MSLAVVVVVVFFFVCSYFSFTTVRIEKHQQTIFDYLFIRCGCFVRHFLLLLFLVCVCVLFSRNRCTQSKRINFAKQFYCNLLVFINAMQNSNNNREHSIRKRTPFDPIPFNSISINKQYAIVYIL